MTPREAALRPLVITQLLPPCYHGKPTDALVPLTCTLYGHVVVRQQIGQRLQIWRALVCTEGGTQLSSRCLDVRVVVEEQVDNSFKVRLPIGDREMTVQ